MSGNARAKRMAELQALSTTANGRATLRSLAWQASGRPEGTIAAEEIGQLVSDWIREILESEFPTDDSTR